MAVAVAAIPPIVKPQAVGHFRELFVTITFDASYPTGGEVILPATLGLSKILFVEVPRAAANLFAFNYVDSKLLAYVATTGVEVANTTDLSALVARARIVGI